MAKKKYLNLAINKTVQRLSVDKRMEFLMSLLPGYYASETENGVYDIRRLTDIRLLGATKTCARVELFVDDSGTECMRFIVDKSASGTAFQKTVQKVFEVRDSEVYLDD